MDEIARRAEGGRHRGRDCGQEDKPPSELKTDNGSPRTVPTESRSAESHNFSRFPSNQTCKQGFLRRQEDRRSSGKSWFGYGRRADTKYVVPVAFEVAKHRAP